MLSSIPLRMAAMLLLASGLLACSASVDTRLGEFELSDEPLSGKLVWHDLITDDVQAARRFYGGLFGWSFENTTHPNGGDYTLISNGGRFVGGMVELDDPAGADYSRWLGYLSVIDVDQAVEMTRAARGQSVAGPMDLPNVGRAAAIQDPEGAVIGLLRSDWGDPVDAVREGTGMVVWNELLAADAPAAVAFYSRLAGMEARAEKRPGGEYHYLRSQGRDRLGVMQRPVEDVTPLWLAHFAVRDVQSAARRAAELGGDVLLEPSADFRNGTMALVTDPNGAILALRQWTE